MIQKQTIVHIADSTNGKWAQTFHLYRGFFRRTTRNGLIIKVAIKKIRPPIKYYKGVRVKPLRKGQRRRGLINSITHKYQRPCGFTYKLYQNSILIFGKRKQFKGKKFINLSSRYNMKMKYLNILKMLV